MMAALDAGGTRSPDGFRMDAAPARPGAGLLKQCYLETTMTKNRVPFAVGCDGDGAVIAKNCGGAVIRARHMSLKMLKLIGEMCGMLRAEATKAIEEVVEELRPIAFQNGHWVADYRRLRFVAVRVS